LLRRIAPTPARFTPRRRARSRSTKSIRGIFARRSRHCSPPAANAGRSRSPDVLAHVRAMQKRFDVVLVEGAGGLLSPLGEEF
jgi:dethiobiotin synthetase